MTEANQTCRLCGDGDTAYVGFDFSMAFQPIVDVERGEIFAHEALVRGRDNASAKTVLDAIDAGNRYAFDQACRTKAVSMAAQLAHGTPISINFLPNAVYDPATCLQATLGAAQRYGLPRQHIIFEITEGEKVEDYDHLRRIVCAYKREGFRIAIDDFGAGYAGLELLAELEPDIVKLDMGLVRDIDVHRSRYAIARGNLLTCQDMGIQVVAEGVERRGEYDALRELGVRRFQGFLFARPAFEDMCAVTDVAWPT